MYVHNRVFNANFEDKFKWTHDMLTLYFLVLNQEMMKFFFPPVNFLYHLSMFKRWNRAFDLFSFCSLCINTWSLIRIRSTIDLWNINLDKNPDGFLEKMLQIWNHYFHQRPKFEMEYLLTIYIPFTMFWHKGRLWFHFLTLDTCLISVISAVTKVPDMRTYQNERNMLPNLP
jgi:hypothetical protein